MPRPKKFVPASYIGIGVALCLTMALPVVFIISSVHLKGGAGIAPLAMSCVMLVCGVMSLYCRHRRREPLASPNPPQLSLPRFILLAVILFCFIPLAEFAGFYATSFLYITGAFLFLSGRPNAKTLAQALTLAALFVLAEKLIFYELLTILTPTGLLF